jgi:GNAT superfamily N-acetyltransferase
MDVALNPPDAAGAYLRHLNASFGDWGDATRFRWAFERTASAPRADLMVLSEGGETLAGSAVTYRAARLGTGAPFRVGIMTGSWTLPAARGRGCFTRVIQESVQLCREQGAALLLAFVTEDNASYRRLKESGAALIQTRYWIFPAAAASGAGSPLHTIGADAAALHAAHEARPDEGLRFTYDREGWAGQFLKRSTPTEVVSSDAGTALIERAATTDRILALYPRAGLGPQLVAELHAQAKAAGRGMFAFTDTGARTAWFEPLGLAPKPGFLTVIAAAKGATPEVTSLALENGDRM